ncbi:conserved hypothetical protein [Vibrio coralliirubri]|uniref:coiled-coil domain-containing protein n=1 Tax=Vibrio coralliirubri TaxID=1516159 RepID=UPI000632ABDA|nr:hypothetical protein [Vibrio coralliirubri]CDU04331.1 conserved hypothetical protein [Vibrio coralliirubri]
MENKNTIEKESILTLKNIRDVIVLVFFGVLAFKLFSMDLSLNIEEFTFTDLLSMLVAFFAIALSIAFYFKATDTSNRFYDNSYAFTREVSEILGRIEAGFGERLKHLDEGYSGIRDRFDQLPFDNAQANAELEKEKAEIESKENEQKELLENLAKRAKLAESEKEELFSHIKQVSDELDEAKRETRRLQRSIRMHSVDNESRYEPLEYLTKFLSDRRDSDISPNSPRNSIEMQFHRHANELPRRLFRQLETNGFIDDNGLTSEAIDFMRRRSRRVA